MNCDGYDLAMIFFSSYIFFNNTPAYLMYNHADMETYVGLFDRKQTAVLMLVCSLLMVDRVKANGVPLPAVRQWFLGTKCQSKQHGIEWSCVSDWDDNYLSPLCVICFCISGDGHIFTIKAEHFDYTMRSFAYLRVSDVLPTGGDDKWSRVRCSSTTWMTFRVVGSVDPQSVLPVPFLNRIPCGVGVVPANGLQSKGRLLICRVRGFLLCEDVPRLYRDGRSTQ